jgi:hypothetical protein
VVAPVTATPSARATEIPTVTSILITPATTNSAIDPGSMVTIGPIGDFGGHPVTSSLVIASIVVDWT